MRIETTVGLAFVLLIAACSNKPASQGAQAPGASAVVTPAPKVAPASSTSTTALPNESASRESTPSAAPPPAANPPTAAAPTPPGTAKPPTTAASTSLGGAKPPTTVATAPPAATQGTASSPPKTPAAANAKAPAASPQTARGTPAVAAKSQPTLDIAALTQRLKDTNAIGVLSKLALKNQVDDLLDQFRAFYQGKLKTTLAELRRPYDSLVLKVLALLQDGDPSLASEIVASREAIWGILSDPKKFAALA